MRLMQVGGVRPVRSDLEWPHERTGTCTRPLVSQVLLPTLYAEAEPIKPRK
jgi:hypothetical protein